MSRQINCMQVFKMLVPASSSSTLIHQYMLPSATPQTVDWWRQWHWLWPQCSVLVEHPVVQVNVFTKPLFQRRSLVQSDLDLWRPALWHVHAFIYFFYIDCCGTSVLIWHSVYFGGGGWEESGWSAFIGIYLKGSGIVAYLDAIMPCDRAVLQFISIGTRCQHEFLPLLHKSSHVSWAR